MSISHPGYVTEVVSGADAGNSPRVQVGTGSIAIHRVLEHNPSTPTVFFVLPVVGNDMETEMLVAGLTGGIASGKSTVAGIFRKEGAQVIDADVIARQVVAPGLPAWQDIVRLFGDQVVAADGTLHRPRLAERVFHDPELRRRLEHIVHPRVRAAIDTQMSRLRDTSPGAVVVQDIPLLLEAGMTQGLDEVIVVYVTAPVQLQRLMRRDGIDASQAKARIDAQMPLEEKRKRASLVIDNSRHRAATRAQTLAIFARLARRAREA